MGTELKYAVRHFIGICGFIVSNKKWDNPCTNATNYLCFRPIVYVCKHQNNSHKRLTQKWTPFRRQCFQMHFLEWKCMNFAKISLKFVPKVPVNNIPALVHILAWRRSGDKPLSELMMVSLLTQICVTRPQWVNQIAIPVYVLFYISPSDIHNSNATLYIHTRIYLI